jgi:predicted CopG family antitoxin
MGTKTLTIMDDAYEMLRATKRSGESFSDQIRRMATAGGSIMEFAGAWSDITDKEAREMKARIGKRRMERSRLEELHKR